jgi:hypothetical protein
LSAGAVVFNEAMIIDIVINEDVLQLQTQGAEKEEEEVEEEDEEEQRQQEEEGSLSEPMRKKLNKQQTNKLTSFMSRRQSRILP